MSPQFAVGGDGGGIKAYMPTVKVVPYLFQKIILVNRAFQKYG